MGIWTGRRQFQVLLKSEPEGCGGLKHPPASFSLGADRGYLFYPRQPAFCRRCRQSGHVEGGCNGASCRFCGQGGHEAKTARCPRPAMVAVGKITSTEAVLGGGGRLQR
ncbi:Zinc finger CCHC domain containing protein 3 [Dissostichus eleginoides]|nr:Zinc finger CCHC domain containing protein 3 [Dissostichus eleginoides]